MTTTNGYNNEILKLGDRVVSVKDPIQQPGEITRINTDGTIYTVNGRGDAEDFKKYLPVS